MQTSVFTFDQLDDNAKEKAREWYRECALNYDWWDCVYEDAKTAGELLGIDIDEIGFSGFWSEGDGAHFTGTYSYRKGSVQAVASYTGGSDEELIAIAKRLQRVQRRNFYRLCATVRHHGHYQHEYCTEIEVYPYDNVYIMTDDWEGEVMDALRDFMRWIYRQLEREYTWLTSDENVDEGIRANGYEFYEDGTLA